MRERSSVLSYGYLAKEMTSSQKKCKAAPAILNYSTFEEQFLKENKRNVQPRYDKQRNRRCSDVESDTGSDGVAINSGGSGRSGDWAPSRRKVKPAKSRSDSRPSLTDSGISLSKEDSESFSEFTLQSSDEVRCERIYDTTSSAPSKNGVNSTRRISVRRSSSLSALPSNIKALDRHNPRLRIDSNEEKMRKVSLEEQENAILKQCYENEGIITTTEYSNESGRSYIFDCSQPFAQSKFPLPDHLNYPLCKYRFKSESILNRSPIKPLKKLKTGWKKLKARKGVQSQSDQVNTNERSNSASRSTLTYLEYLSEDEEDSETILARLETSTSQNKSFIKKLFGKVGGKSYTANCPLDEDEQCIPAREFQRSGSTRSIPEALKDMWTKVHDVDDTIEDNFMPKMSRAVSMPSIAMSVNTQRELLSNTINFPESASSCQRQQNYFSNFFKPMESSSKPSQPTKAKLGGGNDVITGVLGQSRTDDEVKENKQGKEMLIDAELASSSDLVETTSIEHSQYTHTDVPQYTHTDVDTNSHTNSRHKYLEQSKHFPHQHMYASSYDLSHGKSYFYNPQTFYSPHMQPMLYGHCGCCMQQFPYQYGYPYYPPPNFVYEDYHGYRNATLPHTPVSKEHLIKGRVNRDSLVIAPLDVQMSIERKAERRKISEMVFDTFV